MIFGSVHVDGKSVSTHRDSYLLSTLSVVSVRRPFLGSAVALGASFMAFGAAFLDLLYTKEIAILCGLSAAAIITGAQIGQLKLLSKDLRGSELSGVIWGQYAALNRIRSQIVARLSGENA